MGRQLIIFFIILLESHRSVEDEGTGEEASCALREAGRGARQDTQGFAEEDPESDSSSFRVPKCRSDLRRSGRTIGVK